MVHDDVNEIFIELGETPNIYGDTDAFIWGNVSDSVAGQVQSLSEVITEWYLFDSSCQKDIKTFLLAEEIADVFTEKDFMDLICGAAYLNEILLLFISIKLPFKITIERLRGLNARVKKQNPNARMIEKLEIDEKIKELVKKNMDIRAQNLRDQRRKYRESHRDEINSQKRKYYAEHSEAIKECNHLYYAKNKEKILKQIMQYRLMNKEQVLKRKREYWARHKERLNEQKRLHYRKNRPVELERKKRYRDTYKEQAHTYYIENIDHISAKARERYLIDKETKLVKRKEYHEKNRERENKRAKERYERIKAAKSVCAVYLFLLKLKKENMELYLTLYKKGRDPITSLVKTCAALQHMDINLCPLADCAKVDKDVCQKCSASNVFFVPGAMGKIKNFVEILKAR